MRAITPEQPLSGSKAQVKASLRILSGVEPLLQIFLFVLTSDGKAKWAGRIGDISSCYRARRLIRRQR